MTAGPAHPATAVSTGSTCVYTTGAIALRAGSSGPGVGRLALAFALVALSACRNSTPTQPSTHPSAVVPLLTERLETESIIFNFAPGDSVDAEWQQAFHAQATSLLGVTLPLKLHYNKYLSEAHLRQLTGAQSRSWADPPAYAVHTPDPHHGHEALHVYTYLLGWPTDYLLEGIAVGLNVDPFSGASPFYPYPVGAHVHAQARRALEQGELIPIEGIVENAGFWSKPTSLTYPQAGSFIAFLTDEHGIDRLKRLTASVDHATAEATVVSTFHSIYGTSLGEAEQSWHDFLVTWLPGAFASRGAHNTPCPQTSAAGASPKRVSQDRRRVEWSTSASPSSRRLWPSR
jgi:hypothetical protein